jgi:hypothetical protein
VRYAADKTGFSTLTSASTVSANNAGKAIFKPTSKSTRSWDAWAATAPCSTRQFCYSFKSYIPMKEGWLICTKKKYHNSFPPSIEATSFALESIAATVSRCTTWTWRA